MLRFLTSGFTINMVTVLGIFFLVLEYLAIKLIHQIIYGSIHVSGGGFDKNILTAHAYQAEISAIDQV